MARIIDNLRKHDIANRLVHGAFWTFTGTAIGKFCFFLSGILCARILGKDIFGELGIIRSTIGMFIVLGATGIGVTATKFISQYRKDSPDHAASVYQLSNRFSLVIGLAIVILLLLFSHVIAEHILDSPDLDTIIRYGSIMLFVSILNGIENGTLMGLEDFRSIAINTLWGGIAEAVLMVAGAYYFHLSGAIIGFGLGITLLYILNFFSVRRSFARNHIDIKKGRIRKEDWKLLYTYSIPATLSAIMVTPAFFIIRTLLVKSNGFGELAIFEAADQWKVILLFIPGAISQIVLPILASITNNKEFKNTLLANIIGISCISLLFAIFTLLASNMIMNFYGNGFEDTTPLILLGFSTVFSSVSNVIEMSVYSKDKIWTSFLLNLIWAIVLILSTYYLLRMGYGASAPALAVFISYVAKTLMIWIYIKTILKTYDHQ